MSDTPLAVTRALISVFDKRGIVDFAQRGYPKMGMDPGIAAAGSQLVRIAGLNNERPQHLDLVAPHGVELLILVTVELVFNVLESLRRHGFALNHALIMHGVERWVRIARTIATEHFREVAADNAAHTVGVEHILRP